MRIISPVDRAGEARLLIDAGASELYGGYLPPEWVNRFGLEGSINQRTFAGAQIPTEEEFCEVLSVCRERGASFSLVLNAPFYSASQYPLLLDYVARGVEGGITGVILADLPLLGILRENFPMLEYDASTLAHLGNAAAVRFAAIRGFTRTIIPRHIPIEEIAGMVAEIPDMRFDAFMLIGKCPNTEGLCTFHHNNPDRIWPCELTYRIEALDLAPSPQVEQAMARQQSWSITDRRHGCGICALPQLEEAGVTGVKLVGRGSPTAAKLKNIGLVAGAVAAMREDSPERFRARCREVHRTRFGAPCHPNVCYYPELFQEEL